MTFLMVNAGFLAVDQMVKAWVRSILIEGQSLSRPFPGFFEIKLTFNEGIAFGLYQGNGRLFAPIALLISGYAAYYCWKHPSGRMMQLTLGLLSAGALGNVIDRLASGKVTDMFWFRAINFPVFNVADVCITAAAGLLILRSLREPEPAKAKAAPAEHHQA